MREPVAPRILKALASVQMHKRMLCDALNVDYSQIDFAVTGLVNEKKVIVLGTCRAAGYVGIKSDAPVYGLPGTKLQRVAAPTTRRTFAGSGVIAGPITVGKGFRWIGGRT